MLDIMTPGASFSSLLGSFTATIRCLLASVAARGAGRAPLPAVLVLATHGWLSRSLRRVALLVARAQAGTLPPCRRRVPPKATRPAPEAANPQPEASDNLPMDMAAQARRLRLPRGQGWLIPLLPVDAAVAGSRLNHLLSLPEMAELIAAAPALGRVLRPLARMLGVTLPAPLQLPAKPRRLPAARRPGPQLLRVAGKWLGRLPRYDRARATFASR